METFTAGIQKRNYYNLRKALTIHKYKMITTKEIPLEVQEAMVIQHVASQYGIGSSLYRRLMDIMARYPEWFPKKP